MWMGQNQNKKINFRGENWKKSIIKNWFFWQVPKKTPSNLPLFNKKCFGPECGRSRGRRTLSCVPTKHEQLEQLHFCLCRQRPRKKKKQFGRGIHFCWFALQNFFTRGGLAAVPHAHPKSNLAVAKERSAKVGLCKTAPAKHTSTFL